MSNSGNVMKCYKKCNGCRFLFFGIQQNVTEYTGCLIHEILRNAEATECYEMINKLLYAPTFRNILSHSVN